MLSRVASSLYWLGRYIERAENVARFIDVNRHLMLDLPTGAREQWEPLVTTTGDDAAFRLRYGAATRESVTQFLTFDRWNPNSVLSAMTAARENARSVREIIPSEMWEHINRAYFFVKEASESRGTLETPHEFYAEIKLRSHLVAGVTDATMSHGEAWHILRMGRLLERADQTSRIIDVKYYVMLPTVDDVGTPFDKLHWTALLKSASALQMYRQRYGRIAPRGVAEFLILNREFPRALHYCIIKTEESVHAIVGSSPGTFRNPAQQHLGRLRAELNYADISELIQAGLHEAMDTFQGRINEIGDAIFETFFALKQARNAPPLPQAVAVTKPELVPCEA